VSDPVISHDLGSYKLKAPILLAMKSMDQKINLEPGRNLLVDLNVIPKTCSTIPVIFNLQLNALLLIDGGAGETRGARAALAGVGMERQGQTCDGATAMGGASDRTGSDGRRARSE
jgi:hypothetical protein